MSTGLVNTYNFGAAAAAPFFENNAATPSPNEVNGTAGCTVTANECAWSSVADSEVDGSYKLRLTVTHGQTDVATFAWIQLQNLEIGETYDISFWRERSTSPNSFNCQPQVRNTEGWDATISSGNAPNPGATTTIVGAVPNQTDPLLRFALTSSSDDGHFYEFDNLVITKTS